MVERTAISRRAHAATVHRGLPEIGPADVACAKDGLRGRQDDVRLDLCGNHAAAVLLRDRNSWFHDRSVWLPVVLIWGVVLYFRMLAVLFNAAVPPVRQPRRPSLQA